MARKSTGDSLEFKQFENLEGVRHLTKLKPLLARLHGEACQRDRAGNRQLFYNDVCALILLKFFNPSMQSLRDLQQASRLKQVKKKLGCNEASLGSLSESLRVFDPERLVEIIEELLAKLPDMPQADPHLKELARVPTAVDGTLLLRLPQVSEACFATRKDRGWKMHTHFEVLRGIPTFTQVTDASGQGEASEKAVLRKSLEADRCYITDRGYEDFSLFNQIHALGSSYVCRVRNDHAIHDAQALELTEEARAAGVLSDTIGRMGSPKSIRIEHPDHDQRQIVVQFVAHPKRGGRRREGASQDIVLATDLLDVPAEVIAMLYRYRWLIELFFRWLKCVMSCRHLISKSGEGIQIQMYCALIAFLLMQLATGQDVKPNQWTYKLLCLYFQGWADEEEVLAHFQARVTLKNQV